MSWWNISNHLEEKNNEFFIGGISAVELANGFGTPLHVYNCNRIIDNYKRFYDALSGQCRGKEIRLHFAMKTNSNPRILKLLKGQGAWIDAVSPFEAELAIANGFAPEKVLFTGSSVSNESMQKLLELGTGINIDSFSQLKRLKTILEKNCFEKPFPVSFRIDPCITGAGHVPENITTGSVTIHNEKVPAKFGIDKTEIDEAIEWACKNNFLVKGLHFHIGSNWRTKNEVESFLQNLDWILSKAKETAKKTRHDLEFIDVGGGPGVRYREEHPEFPLEEYAIAISNRINDSGLNLKAIAFEPGRFITADAGVFLARVVDLKKKSGKNVIGIDSGFNHLPRPELYNSYHHAINCNKVSGSEEEAMIAGNVCETGDYLSRDPIARKMPLPREQNIIAFLTTGAYVKAMELKSYNAWKPVKELLLLNGKPYSVFEEKIELEEKII